MQCPYCLSPLTATAAECPSCRLTFPRTSVLAGAIPRLVQTVADTTSLLSPAAQAALKKKIFKIQRRFPQVVLQVVVHHFPSDHPFGMHAFWLFNAANFAGHSRRGKDNHSILITLDPGRAEAAISLGYGLECFFKQASLDELLDLANHAWQAAQWASGLRIVLDNLEALLESAATADVSTPPNATDF